MSTPDLPPIGAEYLAKISELVRDFGTPERVIAHMMEAAETVVDDWIDLTETTSITGQASAVTDLSNSVSDLSSWIPYDESREQ